MDHSYVPRNDASRERLRQLVARLSDDLIRRRIDDDWTVPAVLAHLAFWDRFVLERWARAEREGTLVPPVLDDAVQEMVNAAALPQWRELAPRVAAREALEAAAMVDEKIARLSAAAVEAVVHSGRLALIDRTAHRGPHLDEIERALG